VKNILMQETNTTTTKDSMNESLSEINTRLNEIEEKQRILKDRILLIGENLISTKEDFDKTESELKKQMRTFEIELQTIKQLNLRIVNELGTFARKSDLEILQRQSKMFQPLELVKYKDLKPIIKEEMLKLKKEKIYKTIN
jgi:hypothetical protein